MRQPEKKRRTVGIRGQLMWFLCFICLLLLVLFWFLCTQLLEPLYTTHIQKQLTEQADAIVQKLDDAIADGQTLSYWGFGSQLYVNSQFFNQLSSEIYENGGMSSFCVDISDVTLRQIFKVENLSYCNLHRTRPTDENSELPSYSTARAMRQLCRETGSCVRKINPPTPSGTVELMVGRTTSDGSYTVLVTTSLMHVSEAGEVMSTVLPLAAALIFAGLMAGRLSRRIVDPLNRLDLEHPLENDAYEELAPLLSRINYQHKEIDAQLRTLRQKTDEFTQITGSMQEGLVLLDEKGTVLSINHAACRLFQADDGCVGRDFLTVDRSHELSLALETARKEGHSQLRCQRNGREYQLDASRIQSGGETVGTVLLAFDVTEQEYAERNRREFTANVSHELKTPLQGIVGSAELIQSGMVKPEDMPRFVGHIHDEASRMVTLVEDIIRLSQLDEGDAMPTETVDLLALSQEAVTNLQDAAAKQQVSLSVDGGHAPVIGVRRLLYEVIFNLCDNAIKYNVPDGAVKVQVSSENGISSVTVSDTGIGIAPEHQSRVFERFYRVDKSHSKASGGTGLGLSIVKHAVQYHHGDIRLTSKPGEGTVIRITFPAAAR